MVATTKAQPNQETMALAGRLRKFRERAHLTQSELGHALGDAEGPLSPAAISMWENPTSGRLPPSARLEAYARLFCTSRSFEGGARMLGVDELTAQERDRFEELERELLGLRDSAVSGEEGPSLAEHSRCGTSPTARASRWSVIACPPNVGLRARTETVVVKLRSLRRASPT